MDAMYDHEFIVCARTAFWKIVDGRLVGADVSVGIRVGSALMLGIKDGCGVGKKLGAAVGRYMLIVGEWLMAGSINQEGQRRRRS